MTREIFWMGGSLWRCLDLMGQEKWDSMGSSHGCEAFPGHSGHAEGWASGNAAAQGSSRHFCVLNHCQQQLPITPSQGSPLGIEPWDKIPA